MTTESEIPPLSSRRSPNCLPSAPECPASDITEGRRSALRRWQLAQADLYISRSRLSWDREALAAHLLPTQEQWDCFMRQSDPADCAFPYLRLSPEMVASAEDYPIIQSRLESR